MTAIKMPARHGSVFRNAAGGGVAAGTTFVSNKGERVNGDLDGIETSHRKPALVYASFLHRDRRLKEEQFCRAALCVSSGFPQPLK